MKRLTYKILWCKIFGLGFAFSTPIHVAEIGETSIKYYIIPVHVHLGPLYVSIDIPWGRITYGTKN